MNRNRRWLLVSAVTALVLTLGGCAAEGPIKPGGLEQKIDAARTRADHLEIAAVYEQQAEVDNGAMERHRNLARAYEKDWVATGPRGAAVVNAKRVNQSVIAHCENLARLYQQAAAENLALAKEHRRLAAEMKD